MCKLIRKSNKRTLRKPIIHLKLYACFQLIHLAMLTIEILLLTNVAAYECILLVVNVKFAARLKYNTPNER